MPENTARGYTYPVYGDTADFPAQIGNLATDIDTDMQSLYDRVSAGKNQSALYLRGTATQNINNNANVAAVFDTEYYDNTDMVLFPAGATTAVFTQTGLYIASARATFLNDGVNNVNARQVSLIADGTNVLARKSLGISSFTSVATAVAVTALFWIAAGSTLQVIQRQNSGAVQSTSTRSLTLARVGGL